MCKERELSFSIYMLYSLADKWKMSPAADYKIVRNTNYFAAKKCLLSIKVIFREIDWVVTCNVA